MFKPRRNSLGLLALVTLASGCASTREGYLYDTTVPRRGSVVFHDAQLTEGNVVAQLANGERCTGKFNTIPDQVDIDDETRQIYREDSQVGLVILKCGAQHIVRCGRHGGGAPGTKAVVLHAPEANAFVAVALNNDGSAEAVANLLLKALAKE